MYSSYGGRQTLAKDNALSIQDLLNRGFNRLLFPEPLESDFRTLQQSQAISTLRKNFPWVFGIYFLLGIGIWLLIPSGSLGIWPLIHSLIGTFVLIGGACSYIPQLDRWYQQYATFAACGGLSLSIVGPLYYSDAAMTQITQIGSLYVVIIVYTVLGLRFVSACIAGWLSGVLALTYIAATNVKLDWLVFHETFTAANIVGMMMAYLSEYRNRTVFLQSRLLELEKEKSEEMAKTMEKMSREDGLTGLANRRYFDAVYEREWRRAQRYGHCMSVMFIDIDYFKKYNDHYGHQQGDECIKTIATIISTQAQRAGDLAARYGGEEFVVIYPQTNADDLKSIGERTLSAIRDAQLANERSDIGDIVTASIGLACCIPSQSLNMEALLKLADENLYKAKENGRNRAVFSSLPME